MAVSRWLRPERQPAPSVTARDSKPTQRPAAAAAASAAGTGGLADSVGHRDLLRQPAAAAAAAASGVLVDALKVVPGEFGVEDAEGARLLVTAADTAGQSRRTRAAACAQVTKDCRIQYKTLKKFWRKGPDAAGHVDAGPTAVQQISRAVPGGPPLGNTTDKGLFESVIFATQQELL